MDHNIRDIVFSYWSPFKEFKERVDYARTLILLTEEIDCEKLNDTIINEVVTVPWGRGAYKKLDMLYEIVYLISIRDLYLCRGFNKEQAWRLMMTHVKQFNL